MFGGGSRATVAITLLVKNSKKAGPARIHYSDIGEYLSREEKLERVDVAEDVSGFEAVEIAPNEHGDWLNQRRTDFALFLGLDEIFDVYSGGLKTNRDAWCYSFSRDSVEQQMHSLIATYEAERAADKNSESATRDTTRISWNRSLLRDLDRGKERKFVRSAVRTGTYRPFTRQAVYFDRALNDMVYRLPGLFPPGLENHGFYSNAAVPANDPAVLMLDAVPNLDLYGKGGQFFARWRYERIAPEEGALALDVDDAAAEVIDGYRRIDNITDDVLGRVQAAYPDHAITKDDIFFYVYGLLHSPEYRETYAADLKRMLPRIPLVEDPCPFIEAGHKLSELHLGYESADRYPLTGLDIEPDGNDPYDFFAVQKITFARNRNAETNKLEADRSTVAFNPRITLSGIPENAYRYVLGPRSAIEWVMDRYQVKTDSASGIVKNPNDWSKEVGDPRYVVDLFARVVTVSLRTMQIVDGLPPLAIREDQASSLTGSAT